MKTFLFSSYIAFIQPFLGKSKGECTIEESNMKLETRVLSETYNKPILIAVDYIKRFELYYDKRTGVIGYRKEIIQSDDIVNFNYYDSEFARRPQHYPGVDTEEHFPSFIENIDTYDKTNTRFIFPIIDLGLSYSIEEDRLPTINFSASIGIVAYKKAGDRIVLDKDYLKTRLNPAHIKRITEDEPVSPVYFLMPEFSLDYGADGLCWKGTATVNDKKYSNVSFFKEL